MAAERRVYFGKMPNDIDEDDLRKHLSIYGPIVDLTLRTGFAIVKFESDKDALDVVSVLAKRRFLGAELHVSLYVPRTKLRDVEHPPAREPRGRQALREYSASVDSRNTVAITYLNREICWQQLKDFARSAGRVAYCEIGKMGRRVGFVKYETKQEADNAIDQLDGKELMNCRVRIVSLDEYATRVRETEPLLQAGRMRSPAAQSTVKQERISPHGTRVARREDSRGRSPARRITCRSGDPRTDRDMQIAFEEQVDPVEPGELAENNKENETPGTGNVEASPVW
ncbi:uncharacterized protein C8Q71DRAFT_18139 [Rhodofomes roseus]|uniref:RRM domain-containing protein n=1 Tax=Rhodofomes roseus TaxID=34475 RepID=A0ABQ8KXY4_9APHY|nr:uncharacterized protein C8Q71DRAFT_18139 [Rhodofomes roseus]KAH9843893.1 hypothetical protein C8Q71DRAFT_18139 [Rhodofomes roseus]